MIRLKVPLIPNENILNNLLNKNICTINDFLQKKSSDLQAICGLQCKEITKLKDDITIKCSSPFIDGYNFYLHRLSSHCLETGIKKLDNLLGGGLFKSQIYELCGPSASGKTQLCFNILLNVIKITNKNIIYIDTKNDFSVYRIKQILKNKHISNHEINTTLEKIQVYLILDIYSLITCLHNIKNQLEPIIIIDSLSALYLPFVGFYKNDGLCYINHICSILKYLSKRNATIIVTNLAVKNCDSTNNITEDYQHTTQSDFKPAIGKYWFHIPSTRLMLFATLNNRKHQICINVSKSVHIPLNEKCILNIEDYGL